MFFLWNNNNTFRPESIKFRVARFLRSRSIWWLITALILFGGWWFSLPSPLFTDPTATVIEDSSGLLLGARIADDGQWRFPQNENVPFKFEKALLRFEDKLFYHHNGVNPVSFVRAMIQNIKSGKIVSGGSTITMQVIRLSRKGKTRSISEKLIEIFLALRLEATHSKKEILSLYTSNAPFGGNVVGLDAAAWRYFGKNPDRLSWAEAATLAVLPNSPSLIYPGKNQGKLRTKRDRLLNQLIVGGFITQSECELAMSEPLPGKPFPLPQLALHLVDRAMRDGFRNQRIRTTVDGSLQELVVSIVEKYHEKYSANKINNAAALVLDVESGRVLAYVGNTSNPDYPQFGSDVDMIISPRSTGSLLKPFLFASMLQDGQILPSTLIPDIPVQLGSFMPENYSYTYDGAVPARRALARSLNIPAVKMLQMYGVERFNYMLKRIGLTTLNKPASHYGLSIILGGAEATLWDMAGVYASMARTLNHFGHYNSMYDKDDFHPPSYLYGKSHGNHSVVDNSSVFNASPIWFTFEAMNEVSRPDEDVSWQDYSSSSRVAWKTGTSFGGRDAWAIGCTPQYVVAVWVGNADGEGRPGMTGLVNAAPILFEILKSLRPHGWFYAPLDDMEKIAVCRYSGYRASSICEYIDTIWVQAKGIRTGLCPYHKLVYLDPTEKYRVNSDCEEVGNMVKCSWFVLPPVMEYYFKMKNPYYETLPPYREDCQPDDAGLHAMDLIYPRDASKLYIPYDIDGKRGHVVFRVAHRIAGTKIYWYLDEKYIGVTLDFHHMGLAPEAGKHILVLVDENGETLTRAFEIIDKKK